MGLSTATTGIVKISTDEYYYLRRIDEIMNENTNNVLCSCHVVDHTPAAWENLNMRIESEALRFPRYLLQFAIDTIVTELIDNDEWMRECVRNKIHWVTFNMYHGFEFSSSQWIDPSTYNFNLDDYDMYTMAYARIERELAKETADSKEA